MQLKVFFKTYPETTKCPSCHRIGTIRRSRARNFYESIIKASRIASIFKCRDCGWRGVLKKYTINKYSLITLFFYISLIFLVAYIITTVLNKNFGT